MHPDHTLKGSGLILPKLSEVFGLPGAPLSHFEGVGVTFAPVYLWIVEFRVHPYRTLKGSESVYRVIFSFYGNAHFFNSRGENLQICKNKQKL